VGLGLLGDSPERKAPRKVRRTAYLTVHISHMAVAYVGKGPHGRKNGKTGGPCYVVRQNRELRNGVVGALGLFR
jgi:hypothetical protein